MPPELSISGTLRAYSPRIQMLRNEIINAIPRVPAGSMSLAQLEARSIADLIVAWMTWRMRFVLAKPRRISVWSGGVSPREWPRLRQELQPFLEKVEKGSDLTPNLSNLVHRMGVTLSHRNRIGRRQDIDQVLTREGLHHFHVGEVTASNPTGRSARLVFAEVLQDEFRIIAVSDHTAFRRNTAEHTRFSRVCLSYAAKDVAPNQGVMQNPVMSSGHSWLVTVFSMKCERYLEAVDPKLDDPGFPDELYTSELRAADGTPITRPAKPEFFWHFEDLRFGLMERTTQVFFCVFPFFGR